MEDKSHMTDPMLGTRDFSCIQGSFPNPEVTSEGSNTQLPENTQLSGVNRAPYLGHEDGRPLDPSFFFELMPSSEGDSLEHSAPSTPGRTPTDDEREQHPCLKPGCNKIFTHLHKLQRHYRDAHGKPQYDCPYPDCTRKGPKGFARKDNMRQHHRLVHNKHLDPGEIPRRKRGTSS